MGKLTVTFDSLTPGLKRLAKLGRSPKPILEAMGVELESITQDTFVTPSLADRNLLLGGASRRGVRVEFNVIGLPRRFMKYDYLYTDQKMTVGTNALPPDSQVGPFAEYNHIKSRMSINSNSESIYIAIVHDSTRNSDWQYAISFAGGTTMGTQFAVVLMGSAYPEQYTNDYAQTAAHEIGHCMNLPHKYEEDGEGNIVDGHDDPDPLNLMNTGYIQNYDGNHYQDMNFLRKDQWDIVYGSSFTN